MRLIDADALKKRLVKCWNIHNDQDFANKDVWREIENAPTVEYERKKGEWIYDTERVAGDGWTYRQYHCSECGFQELGWLANFCPNCGADMRVSDE